MEIPEPGYYVESDEIRRVFGKLYSFIDEETDLEKIKKKIGESYKEIMSESTWLLPQQNS